MPRGMPRRADELQPLEGGLGGSGGSRSSGPSQTSIAAKEAAKKGTSTVDEMLAADKKLSMQKELEVAKAKPERKSAERNATVRDEGGVKVTEYPYAGPNEYKKGGMTASRSEEHTSELQSH